MAAARTKGQRGQRIAAAWKPVRSVSSEDLGRPPPGVAGEPTGRQAEHPPKAEWWPLAPRELSGTTHTALRPPAHTHTRTHTSRAGNQKAFLLGTIIRKLCMGVSHSSCPTLQVGGKIVLSPLGNTNLSEERKECVRLRM